MAKKASKKERGPRPVEIAIAGILSAILGVVGAVVFLAVQAPEKVSQLPAEQDRSFGVVYFVEGKGGNASHGTWEAKKEAVKAGRAGNLSLVEEELNQWAAQKLAGATAGDKPSLHIDPGTPNFHLAGDRFFATAPLEWNVFGYSREFDSQVSGRFAAGPGGHTLEYERVYVGSCPIPSVFGLSSRLLRDVVNSYDVPDSLREGWANLQSVSVDGDTLKLVIP